VTSPRPQLLLARADRELEQGHDERALACADEALLQAPRMIGALHVRALALVALDRVDEARIAFARGLAIEPDDTDLLRDAADLYVNHVEGDRSTILLGLEYALRGLRITARSRPPEPDRRASLLLLAAGA
jgi:tetratricopeptide (TPR) repeat protein